MRQLKSCRGLFGLAAWAWPYCRNETFLLKRILTRRTEIERERERDIDIDRDRDGDGDGDSERGRQGGGEEGEGARGERMKATLGILVKVGSPPKTLEIPSR